MRLTLLGTGSADGWPNPFCACRSCAAAATMVTIRTPTSVLVDSRVLLDCGPEAPRQAVRAGVTLDAIEVLWIGHDHPDHSSPMALLSRAWASREDRGTGRPRLAVVAAPATLAQWAQWCGPDDGVDLVPAVAGQEIEIAGYQLLPLAAAHRAGEGPGMLLRLTGPDGAGLLYGVDTGALPAPTLAALRGAPLDAVLLDETFGTRSDLARDGDHLDLAGFAREVDRLREAGAVTEDTQVLAVHLSHHNPAGVDLERRLARSGARPGRDGDVIDLGGSAPSGSGHRTLIVGGARSGKSTAAERLLHDAPAVEYAATGYPPDTADPEWAARVAAHRARRPARWRTVETVDLVPLLTRPGPPLLVDCLTLWLTRTLDAVGAWSPDAGEREAAAAAAAIAGLVAAWRATPRRVVAVSNEVGSGVVPATASGRVFRDMQGRLNAELGATADVALLVVAGRALPLDRVGTLVGVT